MRITIISRQDADNKWGGDLKVLSDLHEGLCALGVDAHFVPEFNPGDKADFVFLSSTSLDLRCYHNLFSLIGQRFGLIAFHEDCQKYFGPAFGLYHYVRAALKGEKDEGFSFDVERLFEIPELIFYYAIPPRKSAFVNYEVLKDAAVCIANTPTEAATLKRDCPRARVQISALNPDVLDFSEDSTFLKWAGLSSNEYILQVGRFEMRKNQLATILATKDLDLPLVFIATKTNYEWYEEVCLEAIKKWRKAPTLIISEKLKPGCDGKLKILSMPDGKKLSLPMLKSAFNHAAIHVHPAFYELPGLTYFESVSQGVPTLASSWTTIEDYFQGTLNGLIEYVLPYELSKMKTLVEEKAGKRFPKHAFSKRTKTDMAREILSFL
jgi:hypothetical protein